MREIKEQDIGIRIADALDRISSTLEMILVEKKTTAISLKLNVAKKLMYSVDEFDLSSRTENCLNAANIRYIGDLVQRTEKDLLLIKNFGRKSLKEIKEILCEIGLSLGMKLKNWPSVELTR